MSKRLTDEERAARQAKEKAQVLGLIQLGGQEFRKNQTMTIQPPPPDAPAPGLDAPPASIFGLDTSMYGGSMAQRGWVQHNLQWDPKVIEGARREASRLKLHLAEYVNLCVALVSEASTRSDEQGATLERISARVHGLRR